MNTKAATEWTWADKLTALRLLAGASMLDFISTLFKLETKTDYIIGSHHRTICAALDKVIKGEIRKLIINIAPRYGKTCLVSQYFPAYGFALNPQCRFLHLSYSGALAEDNSMACRGIMEGDFYPRLFPHSTVEGGTRSRWRTNEGGALYATTTMGQITGFGAGRLDNEDPAETAMINGMTPTPQTAFNGAIIIDDPIKPEDALSDTMREAVNRRFETTIRNRVNSRKTPIIIIMQRLHPHDLCGYLQETEPNEWTVLSLPVITTDENGHDAALWEFKHNLEELRKLAEINPFVFETQYMQNPRPLQGLMYDRGFKEYDIVPPAKTAVRKCYIDTADTGSDFLCAIVYDETEDANYIRDVLFTDKPMEYTEAAAAEMITKYSVAEAIIEGNNGGRSFARNVERNCRLMHNNDTIFTTFTQSANKQVRIFSHSNEVQNICWMPRGWKSMWSSFANAILSYQKTGRNAHDDAPDALTGTVEKRSEPAEEIKATDWEDILY